MLARSARLLHSAELAANAIRAASGTFFNFGNFPSNMVLRVEY